MIDASTKITEQIKTVIKGKDEVIKKVFAAILAGGHVLLEDVPGVGKTTLALSFAATLGIDIKRVQCTPDTMPSDIVGYSVPDRERAKMKYIPGAAMTNLLLADEINRTYPKTQSALLEAMEERQVTVDGITHPLPKPFFVLATQNPVGSVGTQLLPNAQLDRFLMCLSMGYPDRASQIELLRQRQISDPLGELKPLTDAAGLDKMMKAVSDVYISDAIYEFVTALTEKSREHPQIILGISPRGALAVCNAAKAVAFLSGRDYVAPEDVIYIFTDVCAHRVIVDSRAKIQNHSAKSILGDILNTIEIKGK